MEGANQRPEDLINCFAKARVGVRKIANAIGFIALLWSTVVLLGGFVSVLTIKDFWSVSLLSFLMASKLLEYLDTRKGGIFLADKNILHLSKGLYNLEDANRAENWLKKFIISAAVIAKQLSFIILACIVGFSCHVSIALSVARLVQRDYGDADGDVANKAKLNVALIAFYVFVIIHSLSVLYWAFLDANEPWLLVSKQFEFGVWGPKIVKRYRRETIDKCYREGVLPNNWNLITFSIGLLESASREDRLWGARVLDTFTAKGTSIRLDLLSSTQAIQNLIDMIGLTKTDKPEIRERAARIVADLASELRIAQFPDVLRCICCLLESCKQCSDPEVVCPSLTSEQPLDGTAHLSLAITEETDQKQVKNLASGKVPKRRSRIQTMRIHIGKSRKQMREWEIHFGDKYHYSYVSNGTKELISQGLVILDRLTKDKYNCAEIIQHKDLVSKITLPLSYHNFLSDEWDHTWVEILGMSRTVVSRLISAVPIDDTTRVRHDMSSNVVAIRSLIRILEVDSEGAQELHEHAIEILTELAFDDSFRKLAFDESTSMIEMFVKTLRRIFLQDGDGDTIVAEEGKEKGNTVRSKAGEALARLLHVPSARDNTDALISARNAYPVDLLSKQDAINLLTKVMDQILSSKAKRSANVAIQFQGNEEQYEDRKLLPALLSLIVAICSNNNMVSGDDFTLAIPDDASLMKKLKVIVETNMNATTENWKIQKHVCQVVIAMAQLKPTCIREFNGHSLGQALSNALETMLDVDNSMLFASDDCEVSVRSLNSLVKKAQLLLAQEQGDISIST